MIMAKWKGEGVFRDLELDPENVQLRMIMLGKLCGAVIGEGGKTINEIKEATNTDIRIQVRMHADSPWPRLHRSQTRAVHPLHGGVQTVHQSACIVFGRQGCMHCRLPMRTKGQIFLLPWRLQQPLAKRIVWHVLGMTRALLKMPCSCRAAMTACGACKNASSQSLVVRTTCCKQWGAS